MLGWCLLSGACIFVLLAHVSLDAGIRFWEVFRDEFGRQAWPCGKVTCVDGLEPS